MGIALLSTVVTRREQFHDWIIGEHVTMYDLATQGRLATVQASFEAKGFDAATALTQAYGSIKQLVRREANIMAFNDAFMLVGVSLLISAGLVWFCQRPKPGAAAAAL